MALTVVVFGSRLRGRFYVQFELDGGAQSVRERGTQSLTRCRKTGWTVHWLFGSFLDPAPRSVAPNVAALICDINWTSDCWNDWFIACLALGLASFTLRAYQSGYSRYQQSASEPVSHQSESRHLNGLYAC